MPRRRIRSQQKPAFCMMFGVFLLAVTFAWGPSTPWVKEAATPSLNTAFVGIMTSVSDGTGNIWYFEGLDGIDTGGNSNGDQIEVHRYNITTDTWTNMGVTAPLVGPSGPYFDPDPTTADYRGPLVYVMVSSISVAGRFEVWGFNTAAPTAWFWVSDIPRVGVAPARTDASRSNLAIDSVNRLWTCGEDSVGNIAYYGWSAPPYLVWNWINITAMDPTMDWWTTDWGDFVKLPIVAYGDILYKGSYDLGSGWHWGAFDTVTLIYTPKALPPADLMTGFGGIQGAVGAENIYYANSGGVIVGSYDPISDTWQMLPIRPNASRNLVGDTPNGKLYSTPNVGGSNWEQWSFDPLAILLGVPTQISPANGQSGWDDTALPFSWSAVIGAASYRVQIDDDPAYGSPDEFTSPSTSTSLGPFVADGYNWRVRAENGANIGAYSDNRTFTIIVRPPGDGDGVVIPPGVIVPELDTLKIAESIPALPAGIVGAFEVVGTVDVYGVRIYLLSIAMFGAAAALLIALWRRWLFK